MTFHRCHYTYFRVNLGQYALHHHHYHPFLYHRHSFPFISCHRPSALRDTLLVLSSCHQLPVVSCVTVCRCVGCARGLSSDIKPRAVEAVAAAAAERKNGIPNGNNNLTKAPHTIFGITCLAPTTFLRQNICPVGRSSGVLLWNTPAEMVGASSALSSSSSTATEPSGENVQ